MARGNRNISDFNRARNREGRGINAPLDDKGRAELHLCIEKGDMVSVARFLKLGANPDQPDNDGQTPLYEAITRRDSGMIRLLADYGASFRAEDCQHRTPLMWAIEQKCDIEFLEQLRLFGADLDMKNAKGRTALHAAAAANRPEIADYLVRRGVDADLADKDGKTALYVAVEKKAPAALRQLLDLGASPLIRDNEIKTPLYIAASAGDEGMVNTLLAIPGVRQTLNDFQTYLEGFTPLMAAVAANQLSVAEKLISIGADLSQRDNRNRHSLFIAVELGHPDMAKMLIAQGADVKKGPLVSSSGSIVHAINQNAYPELLALLHAEGADLNATNRTGETPLHLAATLDMGGKLAHIRLLLALGADPNVVDKFGHRPLDIIMDQLYYADHHEATGVLLAHGADPDISPFAERQSAPLHEAARYGQLKTAQLLILHNAAIDAQERSFDCATPLLLAAEYGHFEVAKLLLQHGANPLKKDRNNTGVLHRAVQRGSQEFMEMLLAIPALQKELNEPDGRGLTPLHHACQSRRNEPAETLIKAGADPRLHDASGLTPLHHAVDADDEPLLLAFKGAKDSNKLWDIQSREEGETPLHRAAKAGNATAMKCLLSLGADVNARDRNGVTPLHYAAERALWLVKPLLEAGANIDARSLAEDTPLHLAIRAPREDIVEHLAAQGADVMVKNMAGETPLIAAEAQKNNKMIAIILEKQKNQAAAPVIRRPPPPKP